jgi:hypothetical protein
MPPAEADELLSDGVVEPLDRCEDVSPAEQFKAVARDAHAGGCAFMSGHQNRFVNLGEPSAHYRRFARTRV